MAEHLRHLHGNSRLDFQEPLPSPETLQHLFDSHQAGDSLEEFTRAVCAARPVGTADATFPLLLDSGSFFQGVSLPRIMDSLIHDNRNTVLKTLFEEHVFGALSKRREGGLRFLVRTEDAQKALLGVEISVLGRKFRFVAESPLAQCFFVDITGVDTAATATAIFKAMASRGARAVYFRPVAYDRRSGLCSSTWRFYFPGDEPPTALVRDGSVLAHIRVGKTSYRCFGKNDSSAKRHQRPATGQPPSSTGRVHNHPPPLSILQRSSTSRQEVPSANGTDTTPNTTTATTTGLSTTSEPPVDSTSRDTAPQQVTAVDAPSTEPQRATPAELPTGPTQDDTVMFEQVSGNKRAHTPPLSPPVSPAIGVDNRFSVLETFEGDADLHLVTTTGGDVEVCQLVLRVSEATKERVARRCKAKRAKTASSEREAVDAGDAIDQILNDLQATSLTAQAAVDPNAVEVAKRHVESVKKDLSRAKSAETLLTSLIATPQAWQLALREAEVVQQFEDFISLHALNRQLLRLPDNGGNSFTARLKAANWHSTGSRAQLIDTITAEVGASPAGQTSWLHARCTSLFELLLLLLANHTFRQDEWLSVLLHDAPCFLQRKGLRLLSESTLRELIQSSYGLSVVTESLLRLPGLQTLLELSNLQASPATAWMDMQLTGVAPESQDVTMPSPRC